MKILVASDIHGSVLAARKIVAAAEVHGCDRIVLLGDLYYHGPRNPLPEGYAPAEVAEVFNAVKDKLLVVQGNCDSEVDAMVSRFAFFPSAELVLSDGKIALCTHGHVYSGDNLPPFGGYDILLHGHTHIAGVWKKDGVTVINPGSTTLPKGGTPAAYCVLTERGAVHYTVDGEKFSEVEF